MNNIRREGIMKLSPLLLFLLIISVTGSLYSQDGDAVRLTVSVSDSYTDEILESALVSVLRNNQVIQTAYTDNEGNAVLEFSSTSVDDRQHIPASFSLSENYPNPFYDNTRVNLDIPESQSLRTEVYNILGQRVLSRDILLHPGSHALNFALGALPTGTYFLVVHGAETQTVKLTKIGGTVSHNLPVLSAESVSANIPVAMKTAETDLIYIRVEKERYENREIQTVITSDTTVTIGLDRLNEVTFIVKDEKDDIREKELQLIAPYVNLSLTAPDTIILKSGVYNVKADMHFSTPIDETIEIASVDTTFVLSIETINAMAAVNEDLESELLFIVDHIDGHSSYMYGLNLDSESSIPKIAEDSESSYMEATHLIISLADGTVMSVIFNEDYYPILWVDNDYVISARRLGGETFTPQHAPHSFFANSSEDTAAVNIKPDNLYSLIDWLESETGDVFTNARNFLDAHTGTFEELQELAKTMGDEQDVYIYAAASFSILAAAKAFHDLNEDQASSIDMASGFGKVPYAPVFIVTGPVSLAQAMLGSAAGAAAGRMSIDRSGPTVNVLICRGATSWPNVCQESMHMGTASQCLNRCPATIECFVDICIPDVMNVVQALNVQQNY